jgi:hypothetical protein
MAPQIEVFSAIDAGSTRRWWETELSVTGLSALVARVIYPDPHPASHLIRAAKPGRPDHELPRCGLNRAGYP